MSTNRTKNEPEGAYCGDSIQQLKDQKTQDQDKCHEDQEAEVDPEDAIAARFLERYLRSKKSKNLDNRRHKNTKLYSKKEGFTQEEENHHAKIKGEIMPLKSEDSVAIGKKQVTVNKGKDVRFTHNQYQTDEEGILNDMRSLEMKRMGKVRYKENKLYSAEEGFTEEEMNLHAKIKGGILPLKSETSVAIREKQVTLEQGKCHEDQEAELDPDHAARLIQQFWKRLQTERKHKDRHKNTKLYSAEEDFTEQEVNHHAKIKGEIMTSKSEASVAIREKQVNQPGDTSSDSSSPCIFKTPFPGLRFQEPELVSIGPYHRGKNLPLDKYKYSFLAKFLSRTANQGKDLCFFVRQVMTLEWRIRRCYSEDLSMASLEFVKMMLVDACFIIEVLRRFGRSEEFTDGFSFFLIEPWQFPILVRDLLMLENQIPFFILEKLFDLSESEEEKSTVSVITMVLKIFDLAFPRSLDFTSKLNHLEPKHLLDLILQIVRPSNPLTSKSTAKRKKVHFLESASELRKSGIEFKPRRADRFTDIHFKDGVLEIPPVTINDLFIAILINCVALEHCSASTGCSNDLTAYAYFMSSLIRYPTDVECLCSDGIISAFSYGNNQAASSFSSLPFNISDIEFDIVEDSYLYKTVMETELYYTGDKITRLRYYLRDPRTFLFCITNLCFVSYSLYWGFNLPIRLVKWACVLLGTWLLGLGIYAKIKGDILRLTSEASVAIGEKQVTVNQGKCHEDQEAELDPDEMQRLHHEYTRPQGRRHAPHEDRRHFKVPHRLRLGNETAYEPVLVSIGPCHKECLQDMERIKMQYFNRLFTRKGEETKQRCVHAMRSMVERARNWYAASVDDTTGIEKMMLVDGCFIIELLCKEPQDQTAEHPWTRINLFVDLLLLGNQLPFFVLKELYGLIKDPTDGTDFAPQAFAELIQVLPRSGIGTVNPSTIKDTNDIDHLLGLVHDNWVPSPQGRLEQVISFEQEEAGQSIGCARELEEAGIEFIKVDINQESNAKSLFDVSFIDGKMKIPMFVIEDNTERLFRNLIAYEIFAQGPTYVIDYVTLMNNLVNTANDVKLLRSCGVILNMLGDDKAVAQMLNKLLDNVTVSGDTFFYKKIFVDVQQHCARPWNTWKAKLRRDYFSTPWARISFAAALLVFLISIIRFILSFFKKLGIQE